MGARQPIRQDASDARLILAPLTDSGTALDVACAVAFTSTLSLPRFRWVQKRHQLLLITDCNENCYHSVPRAATNYY